jgi:tRNA-splicing ligase RtcB
MIRTTGKYTTADIMIDIVDDGCISQIQKFTNHPAFTNPVKVMPDCHEGKGAVIGFTMKMTDKVIPASIGVDIGCGVLATNIGNVGIDFERLDRKIRDTVPLGFSTNSKPKINIEREFDWDHLNKTASRFRGVYTQSIGTPIPVFEYSYQWFTDLCTKIKSNPADVGRALGTLGGGNHFIEVAEGSDGYWVIVHSGSRNFGLKVATYYQNCAEDLCRVSDMGEYNKRLLSLKETYAGVELGAKINSLKDEYAVGIQKDLAYLTGQSAYDYLHAMIFAQYYAHINRTLITGAIIAGIPGAQVGNTIESVHNFIDFDDMIIRKGAIRSYENELVIIPFNMRDGSIIGTGKSNPDWNYSAPHGAGRVMSRSQAKKLLSVSDFRETMKDIYSTSVGENTLDESPEAYKDYHIIQEAVEPTVTVTDLIKPVYNLKSGG